MKSIVDGADSQNYEFGPFRVNSGEGRLLRGGENIPLTPKAFATLLKLIQAKGRVVDKETLMREIWTDSFVEDNSLTRNISVLRKVLGDENKTAQYIETLPKRGYRFVGTVTEISDAKAANSQKIIAVLPFKVLGDDGDIKFFGLGMADSLITRLSNLRQFVVRPTRAVQKYADATGDPVEIGAELKVEAVLDGGISKLGDFLRVTVQFISVADRRVLWGEQFDEPLTNLLHVQDSIVERTAKTLLSKLSVSERETLHEPAPPNAAAYQLFMMGRYCWNKRTKSSLEKAIEYFRQSIIEEPNYAMAHVGLADSYLVAPHQHLLSPFESFPRAKAHAETALSINANLAEAYASLAHVKFLFDWDWRAAENAYQRAISLKPNYATARQWYGAFLTARGRFDEAAAELKQAQFLDPLSPSVCKALGSSLAYAGRLDEAAEMYSQSIALDSQAAITYGDFSIARKWQGKIPEALELAQKAVAVSENEPPVLTIMAECLAASGERDEAAKIAERLIDLIEHKYVSPFHLALVFLELGQIEETFCWLEKAVVWRDVCVPFLHINRQFDSIKNQPRFQALLRQANLS